MKNLILFIFAFFALFACDNSLDINAEYDVENVVYGLLDKDQDTQWVRLHRTYLGTDGLLAGATHSDSLYFDTAALYLTQLNDQGNVLNTYEFYRKDTNILEPGTFTTDNYRLYWTDAPIDHNFEYRLRGFIPGNNNFEVTTPVVGPLEITRPKGFQKLTFGIQDAKFGWDAAKNARLYQGYIHFKYKEAPVKNPKDSTVRTLTYALPTRTGSNLTGSGNYVTELSYAAYYQFLRNNIGTTTDTVRVFKSIDFELWAAADDYSTYINVSQPSQGIVQEKPLFSNIDGGIGLFSSRGHTIKKQIKLSNTSMDSLWRGVYTCNMGWVDFQGIDSVICVDGFPVKF
ncbi:hypothetical protein N9W87_02345 [Schleiferiaceae bacterium]|nr:hypothetical protein [Schleiferiaceae bacterium]